MSGYCWIIYRVEMKLISSGLCTEYVLKYVKEGLLHACVSLLYWRLSVCAFVGLWHVLLVIINI